MAAALVALVGAFLAGVVTAQNPRCNDNDLKKCVKELEMLTSNKDLAFAHTEKDLIKICGHLQEALVCVNKYTSRCFNPTQQEAYNTLTSGAQELLSDLCTNGSEFRRKYLKHAPCYQQLSEEYQHCLDNYLKAQEAIKSKRLTNEEQLQEFCCLFHGYKTCTRTAILERCSLEAADLGEQIVDRAGGPLLKNHCARTYCNGGSSRVNPTVTSVLLLVASLLWSLLTF